jgi:hypothetical protein
MIYIIFSIIYEIITYWRHDKMIGELLERAHLKILCAESVIMTYGDLYRRNKHNSL